MVLLICLQWKIYIDQVGQQIVIAKRHIMSDKDPALAVKFFKKLTETTYLINASLKASTTAIYWKLLIIFPVHIYIA